MDETEITGQGTEENPYIVHSWGQFLEKASDESEKSKCIKFADEAESKVIDFDQLYHNGVTERIVLHASIIDFNNWELRNITVYGDATDKTAFYYNDTNIVCLNGIFANLLLKSRGGDEVNRLFTSTTKDIRFDSCIFSGIIEDNCWIADGNGYGHDSYDFCSFNLKLVGKIYTGSNIKTRFNCCNGRLDGERIYGTQNVGFLDKEQTLIGMYFPFGMMTAPTLTDCYFEGNITIDTDKLPTTYNKKNVTCIPLIGCRTMYHCVWAIECDHAYMGTGPATSSGTNCFSVFDSDLLPLGLYELPEGKEENTSTSFSPSNSKRYLTGLSTSNMKNETALLAAGMPIGSD